MPIKLSDLIARVPPEVEARVQRVREDARSVLQEALKTETRLVMRTPEETAENLQGAHVPVKIVPGHPAVLKAVEFSDDVERILLIGRYRGTLEQARDGLPRLTKLREELSKRSSLQPPTRISEADLKSIEEWARDLLKELEKYDPLKAVLAVREDFLGVYEYGAEDLLIDEYAVNRATILLYWGIIGLVSEWVGCSVEDLTIVVLTHELAHAYTQLGADIEGRRWPARTFAVAEPGLREGLAQYYTDRVLTRLDRRYGGALKVFKQMLPGQPAVYRTHEPWLADSSPEAVRRAMLEVRRWREGTLTAFDQRLRAAQQALHPNESS